MPRPSDLTFPIIRLLLRGLMHLLFRVRVSGLEHVPRGGCLVVANHLNWIDGFLLLAQLPLRPRLFVLGDEQGVHKHGWWKLVLALAGRVVPIDRRHTAGRRAGLVACYRILAAGDAVTLFPEGETGAHEGRLLAVRPGAGAMALRSGALVLPVGIAGTSELYLGREITLNIGAPLAIDPEGRGRPAVAAATGRIEAALLAALPPFDPAPPGRRWCRWLTGLLS